MPTVRSLALGRWAAVAVAAAPCLAWAQASTETAASLQAQPELVTVTAGERYAAGDLTRALLGAHYRDLWSSPIQVPVLDLESYAGGLTGGVAHLIAFCPTVGVLTGEPPTTSTQHCG